jgi:hypothetical protein
VFVLPCVGSGLAAGWSPRPWSSANCIGFKILAAMRMESSIFWDITPCSRLKAKRRFGGICRLHLQSSRISQTMNQYETAIRWLCLLLFHAAFLLCLFFVPEDGNDTFLWKVCWLSTDYEALYPRRYNSLVLSVLCKTQFSEWFWNRNGLRPYFVKGWRRRFLQDI